MSEEIRIGVFVCDCGTNIGGVINVPEVVEYAKTLDGVVFADEGKWICSVDYLNKIKESIAQHKLNRVVVACCTPRTHEPIFKSALKEAGLNPYLLEFVSIREQSSWVHRSDPAAATEKAKELVRMGVAKARLLEPAEEIRLPVGKEALVIGGGVTGMSAALALAGQGFKVWIVERSDKVGGLLNKLTRIAPLDIDAESFLQGIIERVKAEPNIEVLLNAEVESIEGYVGFFKVKVKQGENARELSVSTIIAATGMNEIDPTGLCGYGKSPKVITQLQLEEKLKRGDLGGAKKVVMINCVGSRNEQRGCCNIGCLTSIKNAKHIKELDPQAEVFILHRGLNLKGMDEVYLKDAMEKYRIKFIKYPDDRLPEVSEEKGGLTVKVFDLLLGEEVKLSADLVVLTVALQGDESVERLKGLLKVSVNPEGFYQEAHIKLRPLDFSTDGVYLCGAARSPKGVRESMEEAMGAAMRASIPMARGYVESEGIVAVVDEERCVGCGLCTKVCAYSAIRLKEVEGGKRKAEVIKAICKGCGTCAAECPKDAINIIHYTDQQILAQVEAALADKPSEKIIAFCCHWCALGAVDVAGVSRFEYPPNIRIIRVMCSGRVDTRFVERAFELGAAGVLVAGCEFPTCHYISGNYKCKERIEKLRPKLAQKGYDPEKLWTVWLSAADGPKFVATVKNMVEKLGLRR
ncbi:MAG: CoB--CoM heterodisulfide reductase iron-sulfur subunit A family protein [Thermoprotei archaeon]|nr:MAG: CoB--CoM heterodisulfide reductase iron-sulfur subunit A family protein [Thermoprotei archaeon]